MKITFQPLPAGLSKHSRFFGMMEWEAKGHGAETIIYLRARRLLAFLAILAGVGWCGGSIGVWKLMLNHGYESVEYTDIIFPWLWRDIPKKQADDLLRRAKHLAANSDYLKSLWSAKAALRKDDTRLDGYSLIGLICARNWLMADAREYLMQGLEKGVPDREYLQLLLEVAQASDDPETILDITERYWKSGWQQNDQASRLLLAGQHARALLQLKRYAEALGWARDLRAQKEHPIILIDVEAYALINLGRAEEARTLLSSVPVDFAKQHDGLFRLMAEIFHQTGDLNSFRYSMQMYLAAGRSQPARHLEVLAYCLDQPDLGKDFASGLEAYYERFGAQEDTMGLLAELLLRHNSLHELDRLYQYAQSHAFLPGVIDLAYAQALIYAGREAEAVTVLNRLPKYPEQSLLGNRVTLLRRLLVSQATDLSKATAPLTEFIVSHPLSLEDTLSLVDLLSRRGQFDDAGLVLEAATHNYAHSQRLHERTERFKAERKALREATGLSGEKP